MYKGVNGIANKVIKEMEGNNIPEISQITIWVNGSFDVLHAGHIELFKYARSVGDCVGGKDGDTVMPRILMTNSHDGKNSFQFQAGLYRLVCSNGLVIADAEFANMKIRHMGYDLAELKTVIQEIVEKLPLTVECMNKLKAA